MTNHTTEQFKPNTTVAAVICYQDKFLLVEEVDNGVTVFNQPAGHVEANENLIGAVKREVYEETGLIIEPSYVSGIYYFHRPFNHNNIDLYFLRFCFVVELDHLPLTKPIDDDIVDCHWLTLDQIKARESQLRSPMVLECIEDYLSGNKIALNTLKSNI
ncbi:NUDIX hydrolase [Thalassotalea sp. LPB0316]|uniref:NUDIX hydrolase n=1 Tax=Thalassotalea sp. LPB0316 TaxID=2769490 RepID=UPI0018671839|nr:NUDIX hydrolase [Thalassotalea sp. LPB0316]QOL24896.1 NUDIX hydrolase [Thalassotalea sp. LPB0316]